MQDTGELGLPFDVAGSIAQALGAQAVDRGNVTKEQVVAFLRNEYDEDAIWNTLGQFIDEIEDRAARMVDA